MRKFYTLLLLTTLFFSTLSAQNWGKGMLVKPGWTITVGPNSTLVIRGGEHSTLLLEDDYSHTPSAIFEGNISVDANSDSVRFQQYLTKDAWHLISASVFPEWNDTYLWDYLYAYDEANWYWINMHAPLKQDLIPGMGYSEWNPSNGGIYPTPGDSVEQIGLPLTASIDDYLLSYQYNSPSPDSVGWNLVGNPFTAALDWNGDAAWDLHNVSPVIYLYDDNDGAYDTYNYNGMQTGGADSIIAPGQGFFVKAVAPGARMDFPASQRFHRPEKDLVKKSSPDFPNVLRVKVSKDGKENEMLIGFDAETAAGYDPVFDAPYLDSQASVAGIYALENGHKYTQYWNPSIEEMETVPLGFEAHSAGVYNLFFSNVEVFEKDVPLWLEDRLTGDRQNLRLNPTYTFVAGLDDSNERFVLHFAAPQGIVDASAAGVNIYAYQGHIHIRLPQASVARVRIFDILGNIVMEQDAKGDCTLRPYASADACYVVEVTTGGNVVRKKIFL